MSKVDISVHGNLLELDGYGEGATIMELAEEVERARTAEGLVTAECAGCGICCGDTVPVLREDIIRLADSAGLTTDEYISTYLDPPEPVDPEDRMQSIQAQMRQDGLTREESTMLYDYNVGDPIRPKKTSEGTCVFLDSKLCTIYPDRPYICMLYVCNADERLSSIHTNIVRQGIWDSYRLLGWIDSGDLPLNPFTRYEHLADIPISEFEYDMSGIMEKLADYF